MTPILHTPLFLHETLRSIAPSPLRGEGWGEGFRASSHQSVITDSEPLSRRFAPTSPLSGQLTEGQHP